MFIAGHQIWCQLLHGLDETAPLKRQNEKGFTWQDSRDNQVIIAHALFNCITELKYVYPTIWCNYKHKHSHPCDYVFFFQFFHWKFPKM
jgi:hypothetical protein